VAVTARGDLVTISAKTTVLATGGGSTAFLYHMNSPDLTFDGHSMALELGAELVNMEFYQMILGLTGPVRRMLIPEPHLALEPRLTNGLGDEYLSRYLPQGVTQAECLRIRAGTGPFRSDAAAKYFDIAAFDEVRAGRGTESGGVRADFTDVDPELIETGKLDWYRWAVERGVDVRAHPVDISPHVHAFNGGVLIDAHAETTVPNLFACGEAAGGPHGANRIGGNQFAGTQVFGQRAGRFAAERSMAQEPILDSAVIAEQTTQVRERLVTLQQREKGWRPQDARRTIQTAMWNDMGVHKDATNLNRCLKTLSQAERDLSSLSLSEGRALFLALSLPHLLTTATVIARAALMREESRGPHLRTDFPERNDKHYGKPIAVRKKNDALEFRFRSID
jgi:succinate dehydrogenase/fumarate reductase flavoprotein subunit